MGVKIRFSDDGSRFGICHADGTLGLWHMACGLGGVEIRHPYLAFRAFPKCVDDMKYLNSSSVIATVGFDDRTKRNLRIWDTLMPSASACVVSANASSSISGSIGRCIQISKSHSMPVVGCDNGSITLFD